MNHYGVSIRMGFMQVRAAMALPALFRSFLVVFLSLLLSIVHADDAPDIGAPGKPVKVEVGVFMVDLIEVNGASQTFRGDFLLRLRWQDPRLAAPGKELRRFSKQDVWFPKALVTNLRESDPRWPEEVMVDESGTVTYLQRSIGTFACPLDLRKFPHDAQELYVQVLGVGVTPEDLVF